MTKVLAVVVGTISFMVVIGGIYFIVGISSVYDPIKKYEYNGSESQLVQNISSYANSNRSVDFEFKDITGNKKSGFAFYYDLTLNTGGKSCEYNLKFEETRNAVLHRTTISLVGAHDFKRGLGGYKINEKGVKKLIDAFERNVIDSLNKRQNINIITLIN